MSNKQLEPDKEVSAGIVKHCVKVDAVEHNNQKSVYFPNTTPGVPYVRSHSDRHWRSKC
jgi:hypothetical protein